MLVLVIRNFYHAPMASTSLNISLSPSLKKKVLEQVKINDFSNASDYIRQLIRQDVEKKQAQEELRNALLEGLNSGASTRSHDEVFAELREYIKSLS